MTLVERLKAASDLRERMEGKNAGWLYAQAAERIEALEAALREVRTAIMEHAPDTLWVSLIETAVDRIDADLAGPVPTFAG